MTTKKESSGNAEPLLYLASGSPRRKELFERFWGHSGFTVCIPDFDEQAAALEVIDGYDPEAFAMHLTTGKIEAVKNTISSSGDYLAVAADTIVVVDDQILGKPFNQREAADMLKRLSNKRHRVITAIALLVCVKETEQLIVEAETTYVEFSLLDQRQIDWYISTDEPMDKAGAYGIQGYGSALIRKIDGCYYNVMGLPVNRLMNMLRTASLKSPEFNFISGLLPWS